jgi:indole-3-acetate monooxygenase
VARGALDEIQQMLQGGRARIGGGPMREEQVIQRAFAEHTLALQSVRLLAHDTFGEAVAHLDAGGPLTPEMLHRVVSSVTYLTNVCLEVVRWAYLISGSEGLRNPSRLQRFFRDMHVGSQHIYVEPGCLDAMGKSLLAPRPDPAIG